MSRKRSPSKENGFLAIPYSWNKLLGHNTRTAFVKSDFMKIITLCSPSRYERNRS